MPRWDSNHLILIQYWSQFCSQSGLFNYLAAVRNVLILHLVSFCESELQHEDFEFWLRYLDLGQEDQRLTNKYVFQDCTKVARTHIHTHRRELSYKRRHYTCLDVFSCRSDKTPQMQPKDDIFSDFPAIEIVSFHINAMVRL